METKKPLVFWTGQNNLFDLSEVINRNSFVGNFDNEHDKYFATCFYDEKDNQCVSIREIQLYELIFCPDYEVHFAEIFDKNEEDFGFVPEIPEEFLKDVYKKVGPLYNIHIGDDFYITSCVPLEEAKMFVRNFGLKYKFE